MYEFASVFDRQAKPIDEFSALQQAKSGFVLDGWARPQLFLVPPSLALPKTKFWLDHMVCALVA